MTSVTMQMCIFRSCPLLETLQWLPLIPRMKSNVPIMVSQAFRDLSISHPCLSPYSLHWSSVFTFVSSTNQLCSLFPQDLDTCCFSCMKAAFLPLPPLSGLIYFHSPFPSLADMLFFSLLYPSGYVKTPWSLFPSVSVIQYLLIACHTAKP